MPNGGECLGVQVDRLRILGAASVEGDVDGPADRRRQMTARPSLYSWTGTVMALTLEFGLVCCLSRNFLLLLVAFDFASGFAIAENWPRFRGANGSGVSRSDAIPSEWTEDDYRWVAELPGTGNSSPVIWDGRVFVTAADEDSLLRVLMCFDADSGQELWRAEFPFVKYKKHKNNSYASSTPAVDDRHVYQLWHSKEDTVLIAYGHDGEESWRASLGPYLHGQGGATSPIVVGDLVVAAHDHKSDSFLLAVNRLSGETVWKVPRAGKRACYSTPCVRTTESGRLEIVFVHCYEGVIGVDAETGRENWHLDPFGRASQRALASPVAVGNLVIVGSGAVGGERQVVAIRVKGGSATEAYREGKASSACSIAVGGRSAVNPVERCGDRDSLRLGVGRCDFGRNASAGRTLHHRSQSAIAFFRSTLPAKWW